MDNIDLKISKRLVAVADIIEKGSTVADIGTDHGYLPIYLVKKNISPKVVAMDVRRGPLEKAKANVEAFGVKDAITLRISDGLTGLEEKVDAVTICGMGGKLISRILSDSMEKLKTIRQIIVSPQSEVSQFREFLRDNGIVVVQEKMIFDEGKYYFIMDCRLGKEEKVKDDLLSNTFDRFGRLLLQGQDATLKQFLIKEKTKLLALRSNVSNCASEAVENRLCEIDYELKCIEKGLEFYEM